MDKVNKYQTHIINLVREYTVNDSGINNIETQAIIDIENNHFQIFNIGWQGEKRIHHCILHADIKDEKIWIQQDYTEMGIANDLLELGVPKADIVLAFQSPVKRKYSGFAVV